MTADAFRARQTLDTPLGRRTIYRLDTLAGVGPVERLPYCMKVLLESCLRHCDGRIVTEDDVRALATYDARTVGETEIPFTPGRVVLQDFTGVPAVVDLAAMRSAIVRLTGDEASARKVNPLVPCDLVIDHSVQVDAFNSGLALTINSEKEFERNRERYQFLKWGQSAFDNFRVVPPATGIVHQVNLEYLARVVWERDDVLYPDSLVGTDSHTTMINGLGVVGWGVGGIEAEAVMLGQPIYMLIPEVVGFRLEGKLAEGCTATDLVLQVTEMLREHGVVGKFVEFFGPGLAGMPLANRATIANMAPEYGATIGFFPVDEQTIRYLRLTGRDEKLVETVEQYYRTQGMWRDDSRSIAYSAELELDLGSVEPALAGPKRPQDRIVLSGMKSQWQQDLSVTYGRSSPDPTSTIQTWTDEGGDAAGPAVASATATVSDPGLAGVEVELDGERFRLRHGSVVIAAITSCTNTSNPSVMIGAGLVARNARARGLTRKPWVKTSLAPGSKVVTEYLNASELMDDLEATGFYLVGYGCTTCIGNSGPLPEAISAAIQGHDLVAASVLSGNRNFEGRIHPDTLANYLASPPLVVAYALAGTVDIDLTREPIGTDDAGTPVYLRDIWPTQAEIDETIATCVTREQFIEQYANVFVGEAEWQAVETSGGALYDWDDDSTYIQNPPFFKSLTPTVTPISAIRDARVLCKLGDSVTTDHISPAGAIATDSPAGRYLIEHGVPKSMFNSFGSRRGNDRVMTRGTFGNIRVRNHLAPDTEGGWTAYLDEPEKPVMSIFDAAMKYAEAGRALVVLAGRDYGMGSSRDWAAKGTFLLGVRAVIAKSFERIHRSNLVGMGVLPLTFDGDADAASLGLDGTEQYDIDVNDDLQPRQTIRVTAKRANGETVSFDTTCRVDTPVEVDYYRNGGILHTVLRRMAE
ncbi:MAG: aconitate hydratase AcnA [Phycisphaerales bacterium]|nr:aconitate hydratase AcnA [Phycisphaerae bacterium]NNF42100.1 aconitate hydratase AcnA [Phycisphaerales bacterium]NNM26059.1 aconitate hydratase AcnA [Phycisphaerales bacterium]